MNSEVREIITKAIVSKGSKKSIKKYEYEIDCISKVLGCYLLNHHYEACFREGIPVVSGCYDLHLWYSNDEDTILFKSSISYVDEMELRVEEDRGFELDDLIEASCLKEPKCIGARLDNHVVSLEIEKELFVRVIGDACLKIKTHEDEIVDLGHINENFLG